MTVQDTIDNCTVTVTTHDGIWVTSGLSFEEATMCRHRMELSFSNAGYLWVQHGYYGGETLRNVWFRESDAVRASITIQCGNMTYPC